MEKKFGFGLMRMPVKGDSEKNVDFQQVPRIAAESRAAGSTAFATSSAWTKATTRRRLRREASSEICSARMSRAPLSASSGVVTSFSSST